MHDVVRDFSRSLVGRPTIRASQRVMVRLLIAATGGSVASVGMGFDGYRNHSNPVCRNRHLERARARVWGSGACARVWFRWVGGVASVANRRRRCAWQSMQRASGSNSVMDTFLSNFAAGDPVSEAGTAASHGRGHDGWRS